MDGADGTQRDGRGRRTTAGSIRVARSQREVLPIIRHALEGRWRKRAQTAGTGSQPERLRRTMGAIGEGGMLIQANPFWRGLAATRSDRIHCTFHSERPHQGKGNVLLFPPAGEIDRRNGPVRCTQRLGGLLKYYARAA